MTYGDRIRFLSIATAATVSNNPCSCGSPPPPTSLSEVNDKQSQAEWQRSSQPYVHWLSLPAHLHVMGCYGLCHRACPLLFTLFSTALSTVFHSTHSPGNSPFSHHVLPVLSLPNWSFRQCISLGTSPSALI